MLIGKLHLAILTLIAIQHHDIGVLRSNNRVLTQAVKERGDTIRYLVDIMNRHHIPLDEFDEIALESMNIRPRNREENTD